MFRPMRRIVTGLDAEGRSTILHDGPAANVRENPGRPGQGQALMWVTEAVPASNAGTHDGADIPFRVLPPAGKGKLRNEYGPTLTPASVE